MAQNATLSSLGPDSTRPIPSSPYAYSQTGSNGLYSPATSSYLTTPNSSQLAAGAPITSHTIPGAHVKVHPLAGESSYPPYPEWPTAGPSNHRHPRAANGNDPVSSFSSHPGSQEALQNIPSGGREDDDRVGVEDPCGERSYTELKVLGDGSFGTVWLCDWHSPVKSDVLLSAMQCGAGARPEWAGKRLVALKRMKRVWEGGWPQARNLGELASLRRIPSHPAVIPLYDAFISPLSHELYFVFECMEGNLYQLTRSRKGRPLAPGLIASCFHQIVSGLHHIHTHGYFHRDMKPENLLVTTTGLCDYLSSFALAQLNAHRASGHASDDLPICAPNGERILEKDVQVIVKLADFGLARAISSKPPYTEYVSTRWYRAPEVLLRSTEYGAPVDMWALGTILAEMINLKPLFPGVSEIDQVYRICDTLGDPSPDYGVDERGRVVGGGQWNSGIKLARNVGFSFPKRKPVHFRSLFPETTPQSLVECISDLLRYNPKNRMTSAMCINHAYFHETLPHLQRMPPLPRIPFSQGQPTAQQARPPPADLNIPSRQLPPSHSHHEPRPAFANGDMRTLPPPVEIPEGHPNGHSQLYFPSPALHRADAVSRGYGASALVHQLRELDLPTDDLASYGQRLWADEQALNASRLQYDGSVFEGSQDNSSNPSFSNLPTLSSAGLPPIEQHHHPSTSPHVAAYVRQQQQAVLSNTNFFTEDTPRVIQQSQIPLSSTIDRSESIRQANAAKLASTGKKKKWGLSSVFGGGDKSESSVSLSPVDESGYQGASSLKRTQSGHSPSDRLSQPGPSPLGVNAPPLDPKKAKKEAERQARELAKAKREAAERAQKERARAVLQKRSQLIEARGIGAGGDIIYGDLTATQEPRGPMTSLKQPPILSASHRDLRTYPAAQGSQSVQSVSSVRSHASQASHRSGYSQLSAAALAAHSRGDDDEGSNSKSRKIDAADDSSISRRSLQSRSAWTIDSDPGPRGVRHDRSDPLVHSSRRAPSVSSSHRHTPVLSRSTASLESQLASQLARQATVASASESSLSLGRHAYGTSQLSLDGGLSSFRASEPTSPYGNPNAHAVAHGVGVARNHATASKTILPSIGDWDEVGYQEINPMFRVPQPQPAANHSQTTLPPFAAIASVADAHTQHFEAHRPSQ